VKLRYANGRGRAPRHVVSIIGAAPNFEVRVSLPGGWRDWLGFEKVHTCKDHAAVKAELIKLALERVPLSVGGMIPGPSDELCLMLDRDGWPPGFHYLEIAWRGPGEWVIREITEQSHDLTTGVEWRQVPLPDIFHK
jgi:hypothetical protein